MSIFKNKVILITGGTGSLGEALLGKIRGAKEIRVLSRSEKGQIPLKDKYPKVKFILGDVANYQTVRDAVRGVDIVIHAAAFKFLNLAELQAEQCVMTNVVGSMNLLNAVKDEKTVKIVVGISTDKVAYARNVYGCTKHIMEKLFYEANRNYPKTKFCSVRYGNVKNTTGSVFTIWKKQLEEKKPLTITYENMTRFFFDIEDAVELIFHAIRTTKGGETFVMKMPAFNIYELAKEFGGYDYKIKIIGMRPGEKMHETLIADYEGEEYTSLMAYQNGNKRKEIIKIHG